MQEKCLKPIVFTHSTKLFLGSFPSIKSQEQSFYYSHPKNQFWKLLGAIYQMNHNTLDEKLKILEINNLAVWDMAKCCERQNSADSNLKNIEANDIKGLLQQYKNIENIYFTGQKAQSIFKKEFKNLDIKTTLLPSPSPAYASKSYEEKLIIWKNFLSA